MTTECPKCKKVTSWETKCPDPRCGCIFRDFVGEDNKLNGNITNGYKNILQGITLNKLVKKVVCEILGGKLTIIKISNHNESKVSYSYNRLNSTINCNLFVTDALDRVNIYAILHELGHIACKHWLSGKSRRHSNKKVTHEVEAWKYALQYIKPIYRAEMVNEALNCIKTYLGCNYNNENTLLNIRRILQ